MKINSQQITLEIDTIIMGPQGFDVRPLDDSTVDKYREVAEQLPPVEVWREPETLAIYLVDGKHRCRARQLEGFSDVTAVTIECDRVDAEVRAFSVNLSHPLPLTTVQRRRAIEEIVKRRYARTNNWIAEEAKCSANTVARARERLEEEGHIPTLERLERKDGGTTPRFYQKIEAEGRSDSPFGNTPDFFDEAEEREKAKQESQPDNNDLQPPPDLIHSDSRKPTRDGGYDISEDEQDDEDENEGGPIITGLEQPAFKPGLGKKRELNFAQVGEALPIEITIYVDDKPHGIPVTLMFTNGAVAGVPATSLPEHQQAALIVDVRLGKQLKLVY
jgi:hypothetical protein